MSRTSAHGGERVTGPGTQNGFFLEPTVFADVSRDMRIAQEEIFGPVLTVSRYSTVDEAVEIVNSTQFGLAAGVWGSPREAMDIARLIRVGTVWINDYHLLNPLYPFGGYGMSGIGREHGELGLHEWMEAKHIHVGLDFGRRNKAAFNLTVPLNDKD